MIHPETLDPACSALRMAGYHRFRRIISMGGGAGMLISVVLMLGHLVHPVVA